MPQNTFVGRIAEGYDATSSEMFEPALPLSTRGVPVHGIDISSAMVAKLREKPGSDAVAPYRYVWPSELDLMARIAGMTLRERWSDWNREPFTGESRKHVSVWEKVPEETPHAGHA